MFCSESREQSTYCKHCVITTIKYMRVIQSIFTNTPPPPKKFKQGTRARRAGARSAFAENYNFFYMCIKTFALILQ